MRPLLWLEVAVAAWAGLAVVACAPAQGPRPPAAERAAVPPSPSPQAVSAPRAEPTLAPGSALRADGTRTPGLASPVRPTLPPTPTPSPTPAPAPRTRPGLEVLLSERGELMAGKRLGLVTHVAGVDPEGRSGVERLAERQDSRLVALFAPEHGLEGQLEAGRGVADERDVRSGLPVYSLYGERKRPTAAQLRGLDLLLVDLQDVGLRFYTYVATLAEVLRAGGEHRVPVVVLDRPNPLGGLVVEGNVLEPRFASFVGPFPLPARYGLTIGELARLMNEHFGLKAELSVVRMDGWRRALWYDQTGLAWVPPSPNLPSADAALAYAGTVLFEATNLSEGRGTPRPFQWIGAPWVDGPRWAEALDGLGLPGVRFEAITFVPQASKYGGQRCAGVELWIVDRERFRPIATALHMLAMARQLHPRQFAFRADFFDLLAGTDATRVGLERGLPVEQIMAPWARQVEAFEALRRGYLLYP